MRSDTWSRFSLATSERARVEAELHIPGFSLKKGHHTQCECGRDNGKMNRTVKRRKGGKNAFGATSPPFIDYLKEILRRYPDGGQILKELIQNADDGQASEVVLIHDERTYGTHSVWTEALGKFQGPALYAYNNAAFSEEDWEGIQQAGRSIKQDDPTKVGRFGIGFNSVYHVTDNRRYIKWQEVDQKNDEAAMWNELLVKELLPLSDGRFRSFTNEEDDTALIDSEEFPRVLLPFCKERFLPDDLKCSTIQHIRQMAVKNQIQKVLQTVGGTIIKKDECLKHHDIENYVLLTSPKNVLQVLLNCNGDKVISGITSASLHEKEELKTYLSSLESLSEAEQNLLLALPIFRLMSGKYVAVQSKQAVILKSNPSIPHDLPVPETIVQCANEADRRLLTLLKVDLLDAAQLAFQLVNCIEKMYFSNEDEEKVMTWILTHGNILFSQSGELLAEKVMENLCVLGSMAPIMANPDSDYEFKNKLHSTYKFMQENIEYFRGEINKKCIAWLWCQNEFVSPRDVVLFYPPELDLSLYIKKVPHEFLPYAKLLKEFGVKESLMHEEIEDIFHDIKQSIDDRDPPFGEASELKVSIAILDWMRKNEMPLSGSTPVPVRAPNQNFTLQPLKNTVFCDISDEGLDDLRQDQEEFHVIHEEFKREKQSSALATNGTCTEIDIMPECIPSRERPLPQNLEEAKRDIDQILKEILNMSNEDKRKAIRRLYLRWHPDKNLDNTDLANEAFKYLLNKIDEGERGSTEPNTSSNWNDFTDYYTSWDNEASEAGDSGSPEWCLFKVHQAVQKALIATEYRRNGQHPCSLSIASLAQRVSRYGTCLSDFPSAVTQLRALGDVKGVVSPQSLKENLNVCDEEDIQEEEEL
ncbi:hypothetical protein P4O66_002489 [Electrophorus voltai]|uniref:Sacsin/Nov domain-containing protein n=1 Tax=Electrophorus voltai TaxID=2609070 RepID=A0AAD8YWP3_9TELE|nr:hypothetical protein P4O66_002489 [Electrophorus voltai]